MASTSTQFKSINLPRLLLLLGFILWLNPIQAQQLAFPGAEGFGRFTTGGRGGKVIKVTNLNDSGAGSLRAAISELGARTIVFEVAGNIKLNSRIVIKNGDLTIAGQTAPGDGITIQNYEMVVDADNVIIRYLRFRMGDLTRNEQDALWGRYRKNIIIDHCSMSWSIDECSSFYANQNFTMQWCLLGESLNKSFHEKDNHGYGAIWGGDKATFHHNLLAHHNSRNPRFNGGGRSGVNNGPFPNEHVDFRNNVIYNWLGNSAYGGENGNYNIVNNYYKPGPATPSSRNKRVVQISFESDATFGPGYGKFYIDGNFVQGNTSVSGNNWTGVDYDSSIPTADREKAKLTAPIAYHMETVHTAQEAYDAVLEQAGASLKRDAVDTRIVTEVRNGTATFNGSKTGYRGIIDSQEDVGGWPELATGTAPTDTDGDGMPDAWETANGLNPSNSSDRNGDFNGNGYTNLEKYLNSLTTSTVTSLPDYTQKYGVAIYPNPFSSHTSISFTVKQPAPVSVKILDVTGRQVATLMEAQTAPGAYEVKWDGKDAAKIRLKASLYFCIIQVGQDKVVKRIAMAE